MFQLYIIISDQLEKRKPMIDESCQIDYYHDQEKIKHHRQPERPDPDKNIADNGEPDFFQKSTDNIRKRQEQKQRQVWNSPP